MRNIRNLSIWKEEEKETNNSSAFEQVDIAELNLSVRSYNCLRRAGCASVGDVLQLMGEDGDGLLKVRNLGARSAAEIRRVLEGLRKDYALRPGLKTSDTSAPSVTMAPPDSRPGKIIRPAENIWERAIDDFHLSNYASDRLHSCGVQKISDLYATNPKREPGWYAVRELFSRIANM